MQNAFTAKITLKLCQYTCVVILGILLLIPSGVWCAENDTTLNQQQWLKSIETALANEKAAIEIYQRRVEAIETNRFNYVKELNTYTIQNSAHTGLLMLSQTTAEELEKAWGENKAALGRIEAELNVFLQQRSSLAKIRLQTRERIGLNEKQFKNVKTHHLPGPEKDRQVEAMQQLSQTLLEKRRLIEQYDVLLEAIIKDFTDAQKSLSNLSKKFKEKLKVRKQQALFRKSSPWTFNLDDKSVQENIHLLIEPFSGLTHASMWIERLTTLSRYETVWLVSTLLLVLVVIYLLVSLMRYLSRVEQRVSESLPWTATALYLIRHSLILATLYVILFGYDWIHYPYYLASLARFLLNLLIIFLLAKWALDYIRFRQQSLTGSRMIAILPSIRRLTVGIVIFAVIHAAILWRLGSDTAILPLLRMGLSAFLIIWWTLFWKNRYLETGSALAKDRRLFGGFTRIVGYLFLVTCLALDFFGYGTLVVYGYSSIAKSAAVALWGWIGYHILDERRTDLKKKSSEQEISKASPTHFVQWLLMPVGWLCWVIFIILGAVLSWSISHTVLVDLYRILVTPITIGKINLSLMALFYAFLILFITHGLVGLGRSVLSQRLVQRKELEPGLKASVFTITKYVTWGLGLIIALAVLGVSATSLAVIFGALSIGIGFGLQNIFNNFISGIILLFERPIQVGDTVELDGIWGEVKKINVRATVVQTFDNASMIIPNSEFISSKVTNWSFKDKRFRRKIKIGVAYGSDIELVRKTLLEIAAATDNVLKSPEPNVIFSDHGDSALIFTLRYWTTIDYYYSTETDIRFAIDRLFKERDIEIAFPQRDIHIRSIVKEHNVEMGK
jgi:small-conductance mechanosensitive channel